MEPRAPCAEQMCSIMSVLYIVEVSKQVNAVWKVKERLVQVSILIAEVGTGCPHFMCWSIGTLLCHCWTCNYHPFQLRGLWCFLPSTTWILLLLLILFTQILCCTNGAEDSFVLLTLSVTETLPWHAFWCTSFCNSHQTSVVSDSSKTNCWVLNKFFLLESYCEQFLLCFRIWLLLCPLWPF